MPFRFHGEIPASKSLLNRLLVIRSFAQELAITGDSGCDDVRHMRSALADLFAGRSADCGAAGTTFRFLALRAARIPGRHLLTASPSLLARPQKPLVEILGALGVNAELKPKGLAIESLGWREPERGSLKIDRSLSSQFASAVLLNAWDLDFDLAIEWLHEGLAPSEGYWKMSESLVRAAGMKLECAVPGRYLVPRGSRVRARSLAAEPDLSSCFAVAALALIAGRGSEAVFESYPTESLQPDAVFPQILERLGAAVGWEQGRLTVRGANHLRAVEADLGDCPDLFPVLATLCAFAEGSSRLFGAPHLAHKESDRIARVADLLARLGRAVEIRGDGLVIHGRGHRLEESNSWEFDPCDDHRLAMAAAVARLAGCGVRVLHPDSVNKSFPEFWRIFEAGGGRR